MTTIDLNCDLGEYPERSDTDGALLAIVTSVNIACGGHAGDESTMTHTVLGALANGVAIGAHPAYPDRVHFGRTALRIPFDELERSLTGQISALHRIARPLGAALTHVKSHGALYHAASVIPEVCDVVARATLKGTGASGAAGAPILVGQAGSSAIGCWEQLGFRTVAEAFADRRYEPDGTLRSRTLSGSLIEDPAVAADQALSIVRHGAVITSTGSSLPVSARTICIHSDTPNAPVIARAVRATLEEAGIRVASLSC